MAIATGRRRWPTAVALAALVALTGCRGGMRSLSAPKWPSLGDTKAKVVDAPALASAPAGDGPIQKPSAAATPYPTSSTPAGYVVNDPASAAGASPSVIQAAATDPQTVTYGVTPPPAPPEAVAPAAVAATAAPMAAEAINPQVGPYATLPAPPAPSERPIAPGLPAAAPEQPPLAAAADPRDDLLAPPAAAPSAFPATAGYEPAARVADARAASAPPAPPIVPVSPPQADGSGGVPARYASQGSRFGGPGTEQLAPPAAPLEPSVAILPAPVAIPAAPSESVPAVAAPPAALPPAVLPPATPDGLTSPPVRRPDPVFRPGGTSSYRPAEQIFADDAPVAPSNVRTASFESIDPPPSAGSAVLR